MHRYLIALGSNHWHPRHGPPAATLRAAVAALREAGLAPTATSRVIASRPLGPSQRTYANAAAIVATAREPHAVLPLLQAIEQAFGRRRRGQRWGARVLDLDIVLWSGGRCTSRVLAVPHPHYRTRRFVVTPAAEIAPGWRDPIDGLTLRQRQARLTARRPLPKPRAR